MSKSYYQLIFDPGHMQQLIAVLDQAITEEGYKSTGAPAQFYRGSGWWTAKRKIEYKIVDNSLNICIWKVVAFWLPMFEVGCSSASGAMGAMLNSAMQKSVENIIMKISRVLPVTYTVRCRDVNDNYLDTLR